MEEQLYKYEGGKRRKAEKAICKKCGIEFLRRLGKYHGQKKQEYCSLACGRKAKENKQCVVCQVCKKEMWRSPSKIAAAKHGYQFCSRKCKEYAQSIDGNLKDIQPSHYNNGDSNYQEKALRNLPHKCVGCGEEHEFLLCVHHIDGSRTNNNLSNLEIVCANCHIKRHLTKNINDEWFFWTQVLTDRTLLSEL